MGRRLFLLRSLFLIIAIMSQWIGRAWSCGAAAATEHRARDTIPSSRPSGISPVMTSQTTSCASTSSPDGDTKDNLRIMVLVEPSPFTYVSGYANRFRQLLLYLSEHGADSVTIVTADVVASDPPRRHLGFPVLYTRGFRLPRYPVMSVSCDWTLRVPRWLLGGGSDRPDLIHVTSPGFLVLTTVVWARLLRIPVATSYHTHLPVYVHSYLPKGLARVTEWFVWWTLRILHSLGDATVVTSSALREEFRRHGMRDVYIWPKGIDTTRFHPEWASWDWRNRLSDNHPEDCILLYVGRLAVEKRIHDLRAVMDRLPHRYRLAIVGKGPHEETLRALFADCCERVAFLGPLYDEDLCAAYASADIFVLPSDSETLGFVVMEAMASGVPVVAADAGGIPDMVQDRETGFLVPVGDVDGYVRAIEDIGMDHASRRKEMGQRGRALTETWTWEGSMSYLRNTIYPQTLANFGRRWEQRLWRILTFRK